MEGSIVALPGTARIREVGPRDGFQNEPEVIATPDKLALIEALLESGVRRIEVTSFVRADVIPQLADAEALLGVLEPREGVSYSVLIPNLRGLERALLLRDRFSEVNVFLSASETHNQRNLNRSIGDSLEGFQAVIERALAEGLRCEGVISTAFGCPYEGEVSAERVIEIARCLADAGCVEVAFGDTTGMANPRQVTEFFIAAKKQLPAVELTAHFHNTRGQGLANVLAALQVGIDSFEASVGELGGCPVPAGATGNIATEDLVSMLEEMGIATGIELAKLIGASRSAQELLGRSLGAHVLQAGPVEWSPRSAGSGKGQGMERDSCALADSMPEKRPISI
jgi:hydroxymethylglutaryl-CoA lyase